MDNFEECFLGLLKSIEASSVYLKKLIDAYERLVQHERIPRSQFSDFDLQEIAVHLLRQLHLQISHYRLESKDNLVRFTAYSLLGLASEFPKNSLPEDYKLSGFCKDALQLLEGDDPSITQAVKETKKLIEVTKVESTKIVATTKTRSDGNC